MFELENSHKKILLGLHIKWMFSDINWRCSQITVSRLHIFVGKVLIGIYNVLFIYIKGYHTSIKLWICLSTEQRNSQKMVFNQNWWN